MFGCVDDEKNTDVFVEMGDNVIVDYITYLENGTIIDTSIEKIAIENNIYNKNKNYTPLTVPILENNGYIRGFTLGLKDLKNASNETLIIYPEMAYGKYNESELFKIPKQYTFPLIEELNKSGFNEELEINDTIQENVWDVTVIEITDNTYIFKHEPKINQTFIHMGVPNIIYDINETHAFIEVDLEEGSTHYFEHPIHHSLSVGKVTSIENGIVSIDFNSKLAGKIIYMDVWVRNIIKRQ